MSRRAMLALAIGAVLGAAAAGALAASVDRGSPDAGATQYRGSEPPGGIVMSDFTLRNHDGRTVRSSDLRGRVTVLTFLDSQCTESCPVIAWTVARTLESLAPAEREQVRAVAISTDPAEDTHSRTCAASSRGIGLSGGSSTSVAVSPSRSCEASGTSSRSCRHSRADRTRFIRRRCGSMTDAVSGWRRCTLV